MGVEVARCPVCWRESRVPVRAHVAPWCEGCQRPLPWLATAVEETFGEVVGLPAVPVVVSLQARWSAPCRTTGAALRRVASDLAGRVKVVSVDVDHAPGVSRRLAVTSVPTHVVMDAGRVVARRSGAARARDLRLWVEEAVEVAVAGRQPHPVGVIPVDLLTPAGG
jgi:thioredoxin 2